MCIGADDGCQEVPEPIAPIDMMFVSLEPTRIPISLPDITISGPMFISPVPDLRSMPFISPIALGEGLAAGIGIFISIFPGKAAGEGAAIGIFISICEGEACAVGEGEAAGICIPGIFICSCWREACGTVDRFGAAEGWPDFFIPGMLPIWCLFADFFFLVAFLLLRGAAFDLAFGFGLLIPGICDMSWS